MALHETFRLVSIGSFPFHKVKLIMTPLVLSLSVLLDPPANLTVSSTDQQGQLRVSWQPPLLKYIKGNMMYEVSYVPEGSHVGKVCNTASATHPALRNQSKCPPTKSLSIRVVGELNLL